MFHLCGYFYTLGWKASGIWRLWCLPFHLLDHLLPSSNRQLLGNHWMEFDETWAGTLLHHATVHLLFVFIWMLFRAKYGLDHWSNNGGPSSNLQLLWNPSMDFDETLKIFFILPLCTCYFVFHPWFLGSGAAYIRLRALLTVLWTNKFAHINWRNNIS